MRKFLQLMASEANGIPSIYQIIDYIGNPYNVARAVDTNVVFEEGTLDIEMSIANINGQQNFVGTRNEQSTTYGGFRCWFANKNGYSEVAIIVKEAAETGEFSVALSNPGIFKILVTEDLKCSMSFGEKTKTITVDSSIYTSRSIYLLSTHGDGDIATGIGQKRIYYCKIKRDGVLVRDFIPVKRKSDDVYGLWDKISHKFYTDKDGGELVGA